MSQILIPFDPQSPERMRRRLPEALVNVFDHNDFLEPEGLRPLAPGELPQNIFDFKDGVRMIVSRDEVKGKQFYHVSISVLTGETTRREQRAFVRRFKKLHGKGEIHKVALKRFRKVVGNDHELVIGDVPEPIPASFVSNKGVIHLMLNPIFDHDS